MYMRWVLLESPFHSLRHGVIRLFQFPGLSSKTRIGDRPNFAFKAVGGLSNGTTFASSHAGGLRDETALSLSAYGFKLHFG